MYELLDALGGRASVALVKAMVAASRRIEKPRERLVVLGLAYIRFARRNPEDFLLLFGRIVSRRGSLA